MKEQMDRVVNDQLNESTAFIILWMEHCQVDLLHIVAVHCTGLVAWRSEGSHELKMWILSNMPDILLYNSELQLQFHIYFYMATIVMVTPGPWNTCCTSLQILHT